MFHDHWLSMGMFLPLGAVFAAVYFTALDRTVRLFMNGGSSWQAASFTVLRLGLAVTAFTMVAHVGAFALLAFTGGFASARFAAMAMLKHTHD